MSFVKKHYGEHLFAVLVLALGLLASVSAAWNYQQGVEVHVRNDFERAALDRVQVIRNMLNNNNVLLNTLAAFYRANNGVITREEFSIFTGQLLKDHPYLEAVQWAPLVKQKDLQAHIAEQRSWLPGFDVREPGADGGLAPVSARGEYFPLSYIEPLKGNEGLAGYDIGADHDTAPVLAAAKETRQIRSSGLFTEWQRVEGQEGVLFAAPIHRHRTVKDGGEDVTYDALEGFVISVVSLPMMLDAGLNLLHKEGVNIVISDRSATGKDEKILFARSTRLREFARDEILSRLEREEDLLHVSELGVAGRKWEVAVLAAPGYYPLAVQAGTYAILGAGILFTALLALYMFSRIREHERISMEVAERTDEVAQAKKRIELLLLSTSEGILGLDTGGKIVMTNPSATALLGYSKRELVGQDFHALLHHSGADGKMLPREDSAIAQALLDGRTTTVSDNVFWNKDGAALEVEYTAAPVVEGDDVTGAVLTFRDIAERKRFQQQLEHMARHDQMTGLANRALFSDRIKTAMQEADKSRKKVGVAYFDLNDFKPVNDTLGHAAGDLLLKTFAEKLKKAAGARGVAARMGGDEFTLIAENLNDRQDCLQIVDSLLEDLQSPVEIAGKPVKITASIGIAFYPDDADTPDALVKASDGAMYRAKLHKDKGDMKYAVYEAAHDAGHERKKESHG